MRFAWAPPGYSNLPSGTWGPARSDRSRQVPLIQSVMSGGLRVGQDPRAGQLYPAVAIGAIAPGTSNLANGVLLNTQPGVPVALIDSFGVVTSPRIGFEWDVFGDGC